MSRSRADQDVWDQIFDDLILDTEPPVQYIKDAVIITKNGARFKVSPDDFIRIVAREKSLDPDQSDIQSCSLSIDFVKVKRDVNRWTNKLISSIEGDETRRSTATLRKPRKTTPESKKTPAKSKRTKG